MPFNFSPITTSLITSIPTSPILVLDIEDNTHLWYGSSACWAESCDWGRLPPRFENDRIVAQFDLFVFENRIYLA